MVAVFAIRRAVSQVVVDVHVTYCNRYGRRQAVNPRMVVARVHYVRSWCILTTITCGALGGAGPDGVFGFGVLT